MDGFFCILAISQYCFIATSKVKTFARGIARCFPEQEKVFECAEISARDPSCDLLRRLAWVAVISSHRSHAPGPRFEIVCLRAPHVERYEPPELARSLCARPAGEGSCPHTRDLRPRPPHPESSVELARFNRIHDDKIAEVEAAVCDLWVIEQKNKKTSSWKPTLAQKTRNDGAPGAGAVSALTCLAKPGGWQ